MEKVMLTNHCRGERLDRLVRIATEIGFGEVILTIRHEEMHRRECLTSTGIIMIKDIQEEVLITAYVASIDRVIAMYKSQGFNSPPPSVRNKVLKNKAFQKSLKGM